MVFLDANSVIYLIEQPVPFGSRITARVAAFLASGERLVVSDLVRMQCPIGPLKRGDSLLLAKYDVFFQSPEVIVLTISPAVCDRAARIRAEHGFRPLDSLHLAAAVEHRCTFFLTNDAQLRRFAELHVKILS